MAKYSVSTALNLVWAGDSSLLSDIRSLSPLSSIWKIVYASWMAEASDTNKRDLLGSGILKFICIAIKRPRLFQACSCAGPHQKLSLFAMRANGKEIVDK